MAPFALLAAAHRPQVADGQACWREAPVAYVAYDLLELDGADLRERAR